MINLGGWDYDTYEGVGVATQAECTIPKCYGRVDARGLCRACFQAWYRGGMSGLERRAKRLAVGVTRRRKLPVDDKKKALEILQEVATEWIEASDSTDGSYEKLTEEMEKLCDAIGNMNRRARQRKFRDIWMRNFIKKNGEAAWKERQAAIQRRTRKRRKERSKAANDCMENALLTPVG